MFDKTQPLGLPPGSVRAILAIMVVAAVVYLLLTKEKVDGETLLLGGGVLAAYGLSRTVGTKDAGSTDSTGSTGSTGSQVGDFIGYASPPPGVNQSRLSSSDEEAQPPQPTWPPLRE